MILEKREIVIDEVTEPLSAVVDAAGVGEVLFGPPQPGTFWRVERLSVTSDSALASEARVYLGGAQPPNQVDMTLTGNDDTADNSQPLWVPQGTELRVRWTGATAASNVHARLHRRVCRYVSVPVDELTGQPVVTVVDEPAELVANT